MRRDLYEELNENNAEIKNLEEKIEKLNKEVKELTNQGKIEEMLAKKIEIAETELEISEIQGINDKRCNTKLLEEIVGQKENLGSEKITKLYNEHINLYNCYRAKNFLDDNYIKAEIVNLKLKLLQEKVNKNNISIEEYSQQAKELTEDKNIFDIQIENGTRNLTKVMNVYEKSGGMQGANIDLKKSYEDILEDFEKENGIENGIKKQSIEKNQSQPIPQTNKRTYEKEVSARSEKTFVSSINQDINKTHKNNIYIKTEERENSLLNSNNWRQLADEYSKGLSTADSKMYRIFAQLEYSNYINDSNLYDNETVTKGINLLAVDEVRGLNVKGIKQLEGVDTSILDKKIVVATYEVENEDGEFLPLKRYFTKKQNGELQLIGEETYTEAKFNINGNEYEFDAYDKSQIVLGEEADSITQDKIIENLIKNKIQDTMQIENITEISEITDMDFLEEFAKQCGIKDIRDLSRYGTYIVVNQNEKGEENYQIVFNNGYNTGYKEISGLKPMQQEERTIISTNPENAIQVKDGNMYEFQNVSSKKEFVTKDGHRYSITRDENGKLGFSEIFRENENVAQAHHVETYTYSKQDLTRSYKNININQTDINKAFDIINRTRNEKTQQQTHGQQFNQGDR